MTQDLTLQATCIHCGTFFSISNSPEFCCTGCEFVHGLIQSKGLDFYYQLKEQNPPVCPVPVNSSTSSYAFCDDPTFQKKLSPDGATLRFYIEGLNCTACLWLLEKLPSFCADAESARIDMSSSTIEVRKKPEGSFAEIARTLNRFGYRPHPLRDSESSDEFQAKERRQDLIRIGIAGALTGNIMILAVSLYAGATGELASQFRWLSAALAAPTLTYCAWPFYRSALVAIKSKHLNLDVPIVLAILSGIVFSCWSLLTGQERVYFDSVSMLVFLLLSSRFVLKSIQNKQMRSTCLEDELLLGSVKRMNRNGSFETVSSLALSVGDKIKIDVDRAVPVDGFVLAGNGSISAAVMTGESQPIQVKIGDFVEAGSFVLSGDWILETKNLPSQTRLAQILRDTEKSSQEKSNFVRSADRIAAWFVAIVLMLAVAVVGYFWSTNIEEGISRALALLIVTCPCVFGIAIPLSMSMAIRNAAKKGIIIKSGDSLEKLWNARTLAFDKTGTLTTGAMEVVSTEGNHMTELPFALGLEQNQLHPIARAISSYLVKNKTKVEAFAQVRQIPTGGVSGESNGQSYSLEPIARLLKQTSEHSLYSDVGFFKNKTLLTKFAIGDKLREEAPRLVSWVRNQGFKIALISGDRENVVRSCANLIGLQENEIHSQIIPEKKAVLIRALGRGTVMVGDGVNDAMALATADVGIAVCGSLDVSLRAADIYLTRNQLALIPELFSVARRTRAAIFRNLFFSASFNFASGALAIFGLMSPLLAAVLMPISSVLILLSAVWTGNKIGKTSVSL